MVASWAGLAASSQVDLAASSWVDLVAASWVVLEVPSLVSLGVQRPNPELPSFRQAVELVEALLDLASQSLSK